MQSAIVSPFCVKIKGNKIRIYFNVGKSQYFEKRRERNIFIACYLLGDHYKRGVFTLQRVANYTNKRVTFLSFISATVSSAKEVVLGNIDGDLYLY